MGILDDLKKIADALQDLKTILTPIGDVVDNFKEYKDLVEKIVLEYQEKIEEKFAELTKSQKKTNELLEKILGELKRTREKSS